MTLITNTTKTIAISVDLSELRVAVLEDGRAVEAYIERRGGGSLAGNIYKGRVDNVVPGLEAAFIDFGLPKNGFLHVDDVVVPGMDQTTKRRKKIGELLKPGQEVLVQVVKNPMGTKGARVTMELSLAGRFLVLAPFGEGGGVSKRLPDGERERLRGLVKQLDVSDVGVIARTAAEGATLEDLERDLRFLRRLWAQVEARARTARPKTLVHQEADLSLRVIRDLLARNVTDVLVDSERQHRRILGYVRTTQPEFAERIKLYTDPVPLFERYGIDAAIRSTLNRRVDLPSGGYLLFDYAEAFTVIDINSGSNVGRTSRLEDTITRTNIEAAVEVMRQLRLRDIGGIIVIDFIDMDKPKNRSELLKVLQEELKKDRTKTYLVDISPLGLVEMTRQNVTEGVRELLTSTCPTCGGEGRVLSMDTMAVAAERRLRRIARSSGSQAFLVKMNAKIAASLAGPGGAKLLELERETGKRFSIEVDQKLPLEEVDLLAEGTPSEIEPDTLPVKEGEELRLRISEPHMYNLSDGVARLDRYQVVVAGAIGYVGQEHLVRIERATRTTAYATLLDAKPAVIEMPPEPGEFELPEPDRVVGERLELEQRTRTRRRRTPATSRTAVEAAGPEDEVEVEEVESDDGAAPAPRRRRSRGGRGRRKPAGVGAAEAAAEPTVASE
ncbi:MAG: Rne/Rng family ribonuclease, partial [Gaiellales bacterium]